MKTGRLFAALAAAVLSAFCISVTVSADAEKDSYDFYTYFDFEEEMSEGLYNDFIEFETDGIYLPVEYNVTNISWVSLQRYSYRLDLENADTDYIGSFYQYFDKESYDSRIDSDRKKTGTQGRRLTYRGTELTVFTHGLYDHNENNDELDPSGFDKEETEHEKEDSIKQSCICWTENGHYFVVETLLDPEDPAVLELTHYRKARFNSGVVRRNNKLVYLDKKGRIVKKQGWKTWCGNRYYVRFDGTVTTTSKKVIGGVMYEFDKYGSAGRYTGWQSSKKGKRYYFDGKFVTGTKTIDGKKYMFDKNGYQK